jgi:DNA replication and repair protein RecF
MIIESLELKNFRNYEKLHMEFSPGTNLLYGDNAQGKTNILEALYVCATTRSHRGSKDKEVIEFGTDEAISSLY